MCNCNNTTTTTTLCQEECSNQGCKVFLSSSCVNNVDVDLECSNIVKGQTLSEVLTKLDAYICTKFNSVTNFFELINVGTGSQVYKGVNMLGKKEIRTLVDSGLINIVQGTNDITISVDEEALDTFIGTSYAKSFIKSNESLSLAQRKGDVLYGILDQYTGEEITLSKVTGTPTVDSIMYFQLGSEYFKRNSRTVTPQMFGAKADGATNDTTTIQNAINFCQTNNEILEIIGDFACNTITISNNLQLETNCNLQILTDVDGLVITGRDTGYTQANVTTVKHIGSLTIRGFVANSSSKGITLKNGCLYSNFDKVFISNFGIGVYYKNTGNNNIINWNLLDVRDCSGAGSTTFTKGAFVSPNDIFNIGEITTPIPILTNMGTVLILQPTEGSDYRTYPIVAKPSTTNTYYIGNFDQLPSSGTLVYYTGGGVYHEKHQDNGAIEYKTLRLGGIAGASLTVQSFYGVTVNGGQIEGCYTNVIVGGIFMNGVNPETIYTIRCLFQGLHTEVNDANNPLIYSLKRSMIAFEGCIIPQPFVASPETGVKFYDPSGSDRNSNTYYGKPTTTFPIIEPIDSTFKVYNDVENYTNLLTLDLRDLLSGMTYVGDSRIKHIAVGEYNLLNIPVGETRTLRVRPFGWNTLNGGTASEDIVITGIANVKEYKIIFLLSDKDFTYYTVATPSDGSETKVNSGTNVTITGNGTIATPYVINSVNTTYTAGTAISLVGTTFNNTSPDQVVTLTQAGATTITGTYPNFTISSTDTIADGSETKINSGTTTTVSGAGTVASPYAVEVKNLQKVITYPTDFTGTNYTITNADDNYSIIVDNASTAVTITVPTGLTSKIGVGFIQKGTADVTFTASGTTIQNPIGLKSKGQYYQTFVEQELATNTFYLLGNTKA